MALTATLACPITRVHEPFPAPKQMCKDQPVACFDGPGGTHVVAGCIEEN
jgi:hypothetical protein